MKPYANYKDSGVEFISKVPESWEVKKIKYMFDLSEDKNYLPLKEVQLLSLYTDLGVFPRGEHEEKGNKAVNADGYMIVKKEDIVVNIILAWMGSIGISNYDGVTSPAYDIYRPKTDIAHSLFYHFLFRTSWFSGECYKYGRGIMAMRWRTYSSEFKNIYVPLPPLKTQEKIVTYLDKKTKAIDQLISDKENLITLLKEERQAIISEAVTKGLDPNATMKDSGVEWIGEIPEGWEVRKMNNICSKIGDGLHGTPIYNDFGSYFFINGNNLQNGEIVTKYDTKKVDFNEYKKHKKDLDETTLLISINGTLGNIAEYKSEMCILGKSACYINVMEINYKKFIKYNLESVMFKNYMLFEATGTTIKNLSLKSIREYNISLPHIKIQQQIVNYLDQKTTQIDSIISDTTQQITLLKEYRQAIISEVVTGKVEVI